MPIPKAQKGGTRVRIVGTRRFPKQFALVEEGLSSALGGMLDDEVHAELSANHHLVLSPDRRGTEERLLEATPPSVIGLSSVFLYGFRRAGLVDRILRGEHLTVIGRFKEDTAWFGLHGRAMTAAIRRLSIEHNAGAQLVVHDQSIESDTCGGKDISADVEQALEFLETGHLLALAREHMAPDPVIVAMADMTVDMNPSREIVTCALRSAYSEAVLPDDLDHSLVTPRVIDIAMRRSTTLDEALGLMRLLVSGIKTRKAQEEEILGTAQKSTAEAEAAAKAKRSEAATAAAKKGAIEVLRPTSPRLEDLSGYGAAALWAEDLVTDLGEYASGDLAWSDVDGAVLLVGPPGTGKTLFASALAASASLPLIPTSYAEWQGHKDGHLGTLTSRMRETFAAAALMAPCILFIDEIDAIAPRGTMRGGVNKHDDWWSAIVTALLEQMDGTKRRDGVVIVAACNDDSRLDPALVRSGRLDRRFEIKLPDERALKAIFGHHMPGVDEAEIEPAAVALAGSISGADVARCAREARRVARRQDRDVAVEDIMSIALPADRRSPEMRRLAAVHEAGHAVASIVGGRMPLSMSIVEAGGMHGGVALDPGMGLGRLDDIERHAVALLAGRAAEEVILGVVSGGAGGAEGSDLAQTTNLVVGLLGTLGLGDRLSISRPSSVAVEERMQALYRRAIDLVSRHRVDVEALADLVGEKRVLSRSALQAFAAERGIDR